MLEQSFFPRKPGAGVVCATLTLLVFGACGSSPDTGDDCETCVDRDDGGAFDAGPNDGARPQPDVGPIDPALDQDGDGISDVHEGRADGVDSDGDGTPDHLDDDSDNDGISDALEAGDTLVTTPPVDSDDDGTPDFQDLDSDGNGVRDDLEGEADIDGDGRTNRVDLDNDGDGLLDTEEIGPDPTMPRDSDGDEIPDMNELDSDGDTISDTEEDVFDTDADGLLDRTDLDSDGDGWTDAEEAGDADLLTPARDSDGDLIADYRDPDSDGDGLSDAAERVYRTDRVNADTDSDGVSDLIEIGAGTGPLDPADNPRARGNFVFVMPYLESPTPARDTLQFSTALKRADVYFLMDNTGSMEGTVNALKAGLTRGTFSSGCPGGVIGAIRCGIPEAWFGVGGFDDYPIGAHGVANYATDAVGIVHDQAFFQYSTMSGTDAVTSMAVSYYGVHNGYDPAESAVAALYSLATRDALGGYARFLTSAGVSPEPPPCPPGHRGAACFRPDAVPIVIVMTDVDQHNSPTCGGRCNYAPAVPGGGPSWSATIASLAALDARVVGVATDSGASRFLTRLVTDTTIARGAPGAATDYMISAPGGAGLSGTIVELVRRASLVPLDVSARAVDLADPGESVDAVAAFIDHLETRSRPAPGLTCTTGFTTIDREGIDIDTFHDTFMRVNPGSPVCFDIVPRINTTVEPTLVPQLFRAHIHVVGDGFTPLDDRVVYFLVPPRVPDPGS